MRYPSLFLILPLLAAVAPLTRAADAKRAASTVVLDETGVKNLGLQTEETEETTFETTVFALGRIEPIPARRAVVSSRVPGRVLELKVSVGDTVTAGADVLKLESRQPGDPPPSVMLKAPLGGLVTDCPVRLGEPVETSAVLLEITDLSEVYAIARIPEHVAGKLKPGTEAHIRIAALPDEPLDGKLLRLGTTTDRESGTIDAIFELPSKGLALRPGMRAEFSIVLARRENVVSIPRTALQGDAASRFIYVEDFDLKYAYVKTPVEIGAQNDSRVELLSGVLPGDKVVTKGAYALAFAGQGSISLKEALDAAHGHEHNADGSEMTAEQRAKQAAEKATAAHGQGGSSSLTMFFAMTTGVLLVLLIAAVALRRKPANA
jgi:multidrug efflux pump subunit AcrA (membrane-fusion protein)